jgi:hypothetical protein
MYAIIYLILYYTICTYHILSLTLAMNIRNLTLINSDISHNKKNISNYIFNEINFNNYKQIKYKLYS